MRRSLALVVALGILASCGGGSADKGTGPAPAVVSRIDLAPSTLTILDRGAGTLVATARDASGNALSRSIAWQSSNPQIASVSNGVVTAVSPGVVSIDANVDQVHATATVTVRQVPVGTVSISLGSAQLLPGATTNATAVVTDSLGVIVTNRPIVWSSSSTAFASVSATGVVSAVAPGAVVISATVEGKVGSASLTVTTPPVANVVVTPPTNTVLERGTLTLAAIARDANGNTLSRPITWTSDNSAVATVSATGVVTGIAPGSTTIDAAADGVHGKASLVVRQVPVGQVSVTLASASLFPTATTTASVVVKDSLGVTVTNRPVVWSTSNSAVATVNSVGTVTAIAVGTANIVAASEGKSGSAAVTVALPPVASVVAEASDVGITPGGTSAIVVTLRDAAGNALSGRAVTFTSSANSIATVNASGVVSGVSIGTASITVNSEGRSATTSVQVRASGQPWLMRDSIVVLEYPSIYSVHPAPNPILFPNMRVQNAPFDMSMVFPEIEKLVVPASYDFVLLFSLREIPGWINSGPRYVQDAKNLGMANILTFTRPAGWNKLRAAPHLNNLDFFDSTANTGSTQSLLTVAHEIGHQWSAYFSATQCNSITRLSDWQKGVHSTSCLATISGHWSYLWTRSEGAGVLYSGATSPRFNEFDLYAMGLMGYNEVKPITHMVHEDKFPYATAPQYPITVDTLIAAINASGTNFCQGDCKRLPDTDASAQSMRVLLVIVKGNDEQITDARRKTALMIARQFPGVWSTATSGRSSFSTAVEKR